MSNSVRILPIAKEERRRVFHYITERSLQGAESWEAAYEKALARLEQNPLACGFALENEHFDFDLRQILFRTKYGLTYRIVFRVDGQEVTIYRLRGPGQAPLSVDDLPNA